VSEERRVVTVLFADVAGSTALGDASDPEDLRAVMAAYYEIATRVIVERGGTVEKFIGDAVMAVFGVPQAHDDDPDRALSAALALLEAIAADPATAVLALRVGVNSGEVIATREPGRDFLVTGDAVNVAARLQQAALPGEIVAGERTIAACGPRFRFGPSRALALKGKTEPVACAVLEGLVTNAPARRAAGPFVGRESDLAQLSLAAKRAFDESRPQLVTISAPAGTGKSRLVEEFERHLRIDRPTLRVTTAQCLPYGAAITYLPLRGLLAGLLGVMPDELTLADIVGGLGANGVDPAEAERIATLVGATLGLKTEIGTREREEFFSAWRAAVEGLAAGELTMLVLEDLHWASDSLLDLIEHVVQPRTKARLFMVALTRPELFDRRSTWGTARRNAMSIALEPLDADDTQALIGALLPGAAAAAIDRIAERAEGNPFFAAELARSYGERGDRAELPDTVQATMLARLDLLPDAERRALQLGAVAGRSIQPAALTRLVGAGAVDTLEALAERDLVVPQADGGFAFRHIVIRDVAYGTLTRTERARAHLELARWLSTLADTGPELVAHHYRQAISNSPRGLAADDVAGAVAALERASHFAKRTGAIREAVALLNDALKVAAPTDRSRLYELVGDVTEIMDPALTAFAEAFRLWEELPEPVRDRIAGARLLRKQLIVHARWGASLRASIDGDTAYAMLQRARALLPADESYERARLDVCEAFMSNVGSRINRTLREDHRPSVQRAAALAEAARDEFTRRGDGTAESEALDVIGYLAQQAGAYEQAVVSAHRRMAITNTTLLERTDAVGMASWSQLLAGQYDASLATFDAHLAALRPGEPEGFYPFPHVLAVLAARASGRWDDAIRIADRLAREADEGRANAPVVAACWTAAGYVARARLDHARVQRYGAICAQAVDGVAEDLAYQVVFRTFFEDDTGSAVRYLATATANSTFVGDLIAVLLLERDSLVPEEILARLEASIQPRPAYFDERVRLVRAARTGAAAMRAAIVALEAAGIHGDTPRAAGLLARMTGDPADRADAERRLKALGDLAYIARLGEPAELRVL